MELLIAIGAFVVLDVLAIRFGADSREPVADTHQTTAR